ncbi:hypothetical protein AK812_SmicGene16071 [Symbiodinium microadriaticum]|uniref:Uncharacterized protein n=1 Tax=Symbiodinium microadriaticum TaxID=2951 RepID=A0A1Q9E1E8_SYMMI|nr:hypothetical protein AK812_SmicGene16071 [Symbiodinium microadriaticum]
MDSGVFLPGSIYHQQLIVDPLNKVNVCTSSEHGALWDPLVGSRESRLMSSCTRIYKIVTAAVFSTVFRCTSTVREVRDLRRVRTASWWLCENADVVRALP